MRVDAMVCDFAQVHHGKLFVSGAAIGILATSSASPPHPVSAYIAGIVTVPWDQTDRQHELVVAVDTADGQRLHLNAGPLGTPYGSQSGAFVANFSVSRSELMKPGDDSLVPFAFGIQTAVPHLGAHVAMVEVNGVELSRIRFRIAAAKPGGGFQI